MAFPVVESTSSGSEDVDTTTHTITIPTGTTTGDLLLLLFAVDAAETITNNGTGWNVQEYTIGASTSATLYYATKIAGASESSFTLTTGSTEQSSFIMCRISGSEMVVKSSSSHVSGATVSPPLCDTHGTAVDTLFVAVLACDGARSISTYPTNCANDRESQEGANAAGTSVAIATADVNAASFQADDWTISISDGVSTTVFAIREPVTGGADPAKIYSQTRPA